MGRRRLYDIEALAGRLYDELSGGPKTLPMCPHGILGLDRDQMVKRLDVPRQVTYRMVRNQRLIFGGDEINIPIHYCGRRRIYHLAGQIDAGSKWMKARIRNQISQAEVNIAWWRSMVNANQHDQIHRRYAELILIDCQRELEDLRRILAMLGG
jgi:hypothetical protein